MRIDTTARANLENSLAALGLQMPVALARGVNTTGDKVHRDATDAHQADRPPPSDEHPGGETSRASWGNLTYKLTSRGGDISLKYYKPRETKGGVSAKLPTGQIFIGGAFLKSGARPRRYAKSLQGHVYLNASGGGGAWGQPITKQKSGIYIPDEMVSGATRVAFERGVAANLPADIGRQIYALLSGVAPGGKSDERARRQRAPDHRPGRPGARRGLRGVVVGQDPHHLVRLLRPAGLRPWKVQPVSQPTTTPADYTPAVLVTPGHPDHYIRVPATPHPTWWRSSGRTTNCTSTSPSTAHGLSTCGPTPHPPPPTPPPLPDPAPPRPATHSPTHGRPNDGRACVPSPPRPPCARAGPRRALP